MIPFLEARYDEDEAVAKAATPGAWLALDGGVQSADDESQWPVSQTGSARDRQDRVHIARHDPARALREIETGRAIIAAFRDEHRGSPDSYDGFWCAILAAAYAYADHPDYRPYWKLDWAAAF